MRLDGFCGIEVDMELIFFVGVWLFEERFEDSINLGLRRCIDVDMQ